MKRKLICILLAVVSAFTLYSCSGSEEKKADIYRFEDYESSDVYNIERVNLSDELSAKCTTYSFSYLSDNYSVQAYISLPASAIKSQKPAKCLLYNRGGNSWTGLLEESTTAVVCSACDRIVVASQYRGANGSEGRDRFGGDELNDVIKLIDLCQNRFDFADMDDFCVAGASRGGMMTYMAARRDSRIKRIIAISALSDLKQSYGERNDMRTLMRNYIGCTPEEKPSEYEKRSAICWADEIKVPVLIIHSKGDERVSYKQAEDMYAKLKDSVDCTFIRHSDDVHGIHPEDLKTINNWLK